MVARHTISANLANGSVLPSREREREREREIIGDFLTSKIKVRAIRPVLHPLSNSVTSYSRNMFLNHFALCTPSGDRLKMSRFMFLVFLKLVNMAHMVVAYGGMVDESYSDN
jgi:hypothetical protein